MNRRICRPANPEQWRWTNVQGVDQDLIARCCHRVGLAGGFGTVVTTRNTIPSPTAAKRLVLERCASTRSVSRNLMCHTYEAVGAQARPTVNLFDQFRRKLGCAVSGTEEPARDRGHGVSVIAD